MDEIMLPPRTISATGVLLSLLALSATSYAPPSALAETAQASPMVVTTDTPEYCLHLLDRVSELVQAASGQVPREVTDLTTEGHRMCAHGQTRGGIMRLRSALMIMEQGNGPTYRPAYR